MAGIFKSLFKKDKKDKPETSAQPQAPQVKLTKEDFDTIDVLGKGSFAKVVLVRRKQTGEIFAMKVITKQGVLDHKRVGDVFTERNVLNRSDHPFLLKLHHTFQSESKLFFIMDYMPGGDLDSYLNKQPGKMLDPVTARLYAAEVLLSIMYLHDRKVIYRDLKPENILLNGAGHCILADFGLSKDLYQEGVDPNDIDMRANSFVGSPFYVAPDVLKQKEYTNAVDFWSFGILLYRMLCGRPPFSGKNMKEVFDTIMYTELRFPSSVPVSAEAKDLISKLLIKDAAKRIKGPEVRAHPYWNGLNFDDVYHLRVAPPNWIPMPPLEQIVAERLAAQNAAPAPATSGATTGVAGAQNVVSSHANQSHLADKQQELFTGFSYTPEALMNQQNQH